MFRLHGPLFEEHQEETQGGGDGSQQQTQFDPAKFRTEFKAELLGEIRKDLNGIDKKFKNNFESFKSDLQSWLKPAEQQQQEQHGEEQKAGGEQSQQQEKKPEVNPQILALEKKVREMEQRDKLRQAEADRRAQEADRKEVEALTRTAIANHKFNSDRGPKDLFSLVKSDIKRGDDGNLYGPDGMTLEEYIAKEYNERPFLHPARPVNGSGAGPSNNDTTYGGKALDREGIRPGMTAEEIAEYGKTLSSALSGRR